MNLDFLRSLTDEGLAEWYANCSQDDIQYAQDLLDAWEALLVAESTGERPAGYLLH